MEFREEGQGKQRGERERMRDRSGVGRRQERDKKNKRYKQQCK